MPAVPLEPDDSYPVEVGRTRRRRQARDWDLVLAATGVPHETRYLDDEAVLFAPRAEAERAVRELALFEAENRGWPRVDELPEVLTAGSFGVAVWALLLLLVDLCSRHHAFGRDWRAAGRSAAALVREGEWWRAITALTLHADLYHLLGNLAFGALFVGLACQVLGTGPALFATLAAGALGNLANAWIQDPSHASIGASTAVFGALGILVGHRALQRRPKRERARSRRWIPLLAGVFLLGYLGIGGQREDGTAPDRIDVGAHVLGFVVGLGVGALRARTHAWRPGPRQQVALGLAAGLLIALAWALALA